MPCYGQRDSTAHASGTQDNPNMMLCAILNYFPFLNNKKDKDVFAAQIEPANICTGRGREAAAAGGGLSM